MVDEAHDILGELLAGNERIGTEWALLAHEEAVEAVDWREKEENVRFAMGTEVARGIAGEVEGIGGAVAASKGSLRDARDPLLR